VRFVRAGIPAVTSRRRAPVVLGTLAVFLVAASAAASAGGLLPTLTVIQTTAGLNDVVSGGFEPPDVTVAAGPGVVVELVNLAARVWRTDGAAMQQAQTVTLSSLFAAGADRLTDPRIVYDAPSGRFFASISDVDTNSVVLAVSRGADPSSGWNVYSFVAPGCADQPRLGVADGVVVLGADVFKSCDDGLSPALGGELWIVNKQQLVAGAASPSFTTFGPDRQYESLTPVQSLSATSTEYVVALDTPLSRVVHLLTVDGVPPTVVRVQEAASAPISPLAPPPAALQPRTGGGSRQPSIETNDDRVLDSVWENGKLWLSANAGCTPLGDTTLRSCARVIEIATATRTVTWDTDIAKPGAYLFYPAIRPDSSGNLVVVYGESSAAELPHLAAVGRAPDGTFSAAVTVAQSASQHVGGRYGDYFGAARDPLHPELVWVAGEYGVDVEGVRGWSTSVAAVEVTSAGVTPPAVSGPPPPGVRARPVTGRVGGAVRLAYTALDDGSAIRERLVVTARGTVVFRATTTAGKLTAEQSYFVLWHPAKRFQGTFRWCVRSVAANGTQSPQSCSTVALR
jgi:hypothetical protein